MKIRWVIYLSVMTFSFTLVSLLLMTWQDSYIRTLPQSTANVTSPTEKLLVEHKDDCWNSKNETQLDFPTAAIVRMNNEVFYTTNSNLVDIAFLDALAQIELLGGVDSDILETVALCR